MVGSVCAHLMYHSGSTTNLLVPLLGRVEIVRGQGLREILQTIVIHVVKDAKPLEYFHTLFHHHALPSVTTPLYHDSDFGDSKLI